MNARRLVTFLVLVAGTFASAGCYKGNIDVKIPDYSFNRNGSSSQSPDRSSGRLLADRRVDGDMPIIGISSNHYGNSTSLSDTYVNAVIEAGGLVVILPVFGDKKLAEQYVALLDGLVLSGGDDVPPAAYGHKAHRLTRTVSATRYTFEKNLLSAWLRAEKPLLGVCRGLQQTNVVLGGTLIQDIPSLVQQPKIHRGGKLHNITVEDDTLLADLIGDGKKMVNSNHHQAAGRVGKGLVVTARSDDGVIEAMESKDDDQFLLLVQWHPEIMDKKHRNAIYGEFVKEAKKAMKK